jgi:hypothetical protein
MDHLRPSAVASNDRKASRRPPAEESTLLHSLPYNPPYSPAKNKRR